MKQDELLKLDELLAECGESVEALDSLYRMTYTKVCSVCYAVSKNKCEAQDDAHDTYLRLISVYKKYKSGTNPLAFVLRVAVNVTKENLKKRKRLVLVEEPAADNGNDDAVDQAESRLYTEQLLARLDENKRLIVMLHIYSELTFKEISTVMGMNESSVYSQYEKALGILKYEVEQ